jgi:hypothetical protein
MRTRRAMEADRLWKSLRDSHNPWKTLRVSHSSHSADDDELNRMSAKAGQGHFTQLQGSFRLPSKTIPSQPSSAEQVSSPSAEDVPGGGGEGAE